MVSRAFVWFRLLTIVPWTSLIGVCQQMTITNLWAVKIIDGPDVFANGASSKTSVVRSKLDCVRAFTNGDFVAVNYWKTTKRCELFAKLPMDYQVCNYSCVHITALPEYSNAGNSTLSTCMLRTKSFVVPIQSINGWIVVHELHHTSFSWNRPWSVYKSGFGSLGSDYWFGLEKMHQMTAAAAAVYRVRIEVRRTVDNATLWTEMAVFAVGPESDYYRLTWSGMTGDAELTQTTPDVVTYETGMAFATYDNDHTPYYSNCPSLQGGGWWFRSCYAICLTCVDNRYQCPTSNGFNAVTGTVCVDYNRMLIRAV